MSTNETLTPKQRDGLFAVAAESIGRGARGLEVTGLHGSTADALERRGLICLGLRQGRNSGKAVYRLTRRGRRVYDTAAA